MLKIEFTRSRSLSFNEALSLARSFSSFKEESGVYSVSEDIFSGWDKISRLYNLVSGWSGCDIYIKGKKLLKQHRSSMFYALQAVVLCANHQHQHHCLLPNGLMGWGCSNIRRIARHLDNYVSCYWYDFGKFSQDTWVINKDLLFESLIAQASEMHLELCPFFDKNTVRRIVDSLPDYIHIDGVTWIVKYRRDFVGQKIMNIPFGVQHILQEEVEIAPEEKSIDEMTDEEINRLIEERRKRLNRP